MIDICERCSEVVAYRSIPNAARLCAFNPLISVLPMKLVLFIDFKWISVHHMDSKRNPEFNENASEADQAKGNATRF